MTYTVSIGGQLEELQYYLKMKRRKKSEQLEQWHQVPRGEKAEKEVRRPNNAGWPVWAGK